MKYELDDPTNLLDRYDFVLSDESGDHGFRVDWQNGEQRPFIRASESQVPTTATQSSEGAEEVYSGRDLSDSWRIFFRDFTAGAGQVTRDTVSYVAGRYFESHNIDISREDGIRLAPAQKFSPVSPAPLAGQICEFKNKLVCTLTSSPWLAAYDPATDAWTSVSWGYGEPTALATDGEALYIATSGTSGIIKTDDLASFSLYADVVSVSSLCYCTNYLYCVQGDQLGVVDMSNVFVPLSLEGALAPQRTTFGLTSAGSWVYWGVTSGARSWVYAAQYNPGDSTLTKPFEQYVELPTGFVGTTLHGYLGNIFIGGHKYSRFEGTGMGVVYLATQDGITLLTSIGEDPNVLTSAPADLAAYDNRVQNLCGYDDDLWIATGRALFSWQLKKGGYAHVADTGSYVDEQDIEAVSASFESWTTVSIPGAQLEPEDIIVGPDVNSNGWEQIPQDYLMAPSDTVSLRTDDGIMRSCYPAQHKVCWGTDSPYARADEYASQFSLRAWSSDQLTTNPDRQVLIYDYDKSRFLGPTYIDPDLGATLEVVTTRLTGRCLSLEIADDAHVAQVRVWAGQGDDLSFKVQMADGQITNWKTYEQSTGRRQYQLFRLTLKGTTARLWICGLDGVYTEVLSTTNAPQLDIDPGGVVSFQQRIRVAQGWMWSAATTVKQELWICDLSEMRFCVHGAYQPGYIPGARTMTNFAVLGGVPYLPVTDGLLSLDLSNFATEGTLITSWSTGRQPSVLKKFTAIDVNHSPLLEGEAVSVVLKSDDGSSGGLQLTGGEQGNSVGTLDPVAIDLLTTSRVRLELRLSGKVSKRVSTGSSPTNLYTEHSPVLTSAVVRYGIEPVTRYQLLVDCRQHVKTKTDENYDWEAARDYLDSLRNGAIVMLHYPGNSVRVRIEQVQDTVLTPSKEHDIFPMQSYRTLILREVTA